MDNNTGSSTDPADLDERALPADTHAEKQTDLNFPPDREPNTIKSVGGRVRLYSESQVYTISRCEEAEPGEGGVASEEGAGDGAPFRGRSQSAPAALWAAKRYGRQLRRMSDEFDTWLDRGEQKRSGVSATHRQGLRGWFSFLWSPKEEEGRD